MKINIKEALDELISTKGNVNGRSCSGSLGAIAGMAI
jgi:hypothetical protein